MNPSKSAQDVLRCNLCETPVPPLCCEVCNIYLCKGCVVDHILDETTEHKVLSIKQTLSALRYPKCLKHSSKNCELYCEQCTIPICVQCASTQEHRGHGFKDLLEFVERRREASQTDLKELESSILIEHKEFASCIPNQKANLDKTLEELKSAIDEHSEKLHQQVSDVVEKFKSDIVKKHAERIAALTKTEDKIAFKISDIEKCILSVQELQTSRDLGLVLEYKSRNEELRKTPPNLNVTLPTFVAYDITNNKLNKLFGSLTMESDDRNTLEQDVKENKLSSSKTRVTVMNPIKSAQDVLRCNLRETYVHRFFCERQQLVRRRRRYSRRITTCTRTEDMHGISSPRNLKQIPKTDQLPMSGEEDEEES